MTTIKMNKVASSYLDAVGYDADTKTLRIHFKPSKNDPVGPTFDYAKVPAGTLETLLAAQHPGAVFHSTIRGKFDVMKVMQP